MTKKKRDVKAEHEEAVRKFNAQPTPDIWVCFFWPEFDRWQAIAASEVQRPLVAEMMTALKMMRGENAESSVLAGDALNALAEATLNQHDVPRMAGLLLIVKDHFKAPYLFVTVKREHEGSTVKVTEIPAKTKEEARKWVDMHPAIIMSQMNLVQGLKKGPTQ